MITLDGTSLSCERLHAIGHGARVAACDNALGAMARNAEGVPEEGDVLAAKRQWLIGPHAQGRRGEALAKTFIIGHCAGVGEPLPRSIVRATIAARSNVLLQAVSGCRPDAVHALLAILAGGPLPLVPSLALK